MPRTHWEVKMRRVAKPTVPVHYHPSRSLTFRGC